MQTYSSVKTLWGAHTEAFRRGSGNTYAPVAYSTLNEHFSIEETTMPAAGESPTEEYLIIGRGGHRNVAGAEGDNLTDILQHRINDAVLFEDIPFILREVTNDLSPTEREKFRYRRLEEYNGTQYFGYYAMKIDIEQAAPVIKKITIDGGNMTTEDYIPDSTQLTATPVSMENGIVNQSTGEHISIRTPFAFTLTYEIIEELRNVIDIVFGDARYGVISEMGIVSGIDRVISSTVGGVSATYEEVIGGTVFNFLGCNIPLIQQTADIPFQFNIGTTLKYLT